MTKKKNTKFLITGTAGFIGFHLAKALLEKKFIVLGIDGLTKYYDTNLKKNRHSILKKFVNFSAHEIKIEETMKLEKICLKFNPDFIIHLAAQAGVRYSFVNPKSFVRSNLDGFFNILELAKKINPIHFILASTSSVYGANNLTPFKETDKSDLQLSFYAATKKANEAMSHTYAYNHKIPTTVLRFFTVYGPWGRPDMALFKFTNSILSDNPIDIYNYGKMNRAFTFIDDLIESIILLLDKPPEEPQKRKKIYKSDSISEVAPWRIVNIGNSETIGVMKFIEILESILGKKSKKNFLKMQSGDIKDTISSSLLLEELIGKRNNTSLYQGIKKFVEWYKIYYEKN